MFGIGIPEIIIVALAVVIFFFGGKKITEISRSVGRMSGEFKKGKRDIERELQEGEAEATNNSQTNVSPTVTTENTSPQSPQTK